MLTTRKSLATNSVREMGLENLSTCKMLADRKSPRGTVMAASVTASSSSATPGQRKTIASVNSRSSKTTVASRERSSLMATAVSSRKSAVEKPRWR